MGKRTPRTPMDSQPEASDISRGTEGMEQIGSAPGIQYPGSSDETPAVMSETVLQNEELCCPKVGLDAFQGI